MDCKKIQDLIITDYLDRELEEPGRKQVDEHIKLCTACSEYKEKLLNAAQRPFEEVREVRPPEKIWEKIESALDAEERIQAKQPGIGFLETIRRSLENIFPKARPVWGVALGVVLVLTLFTVTKLPFTGPQDVTKLYIAEQMGYLDELDTYTNGDNDSLGTTIENFFM